eukprot:scaffold144359_cov33-Prasinocladus_malaysianus.AAC.1
MYPESLRGISSPRPLRALPQEIEMSRPRRPCRHLCSVAGINMHRLRRAKAPPRTRRASRSSEPVPSRQAN